MSAQLRSQEALEELKKSNPYAEKYANKIAAIQKTKPEEFLARIEAQQKKEMAEEKQRSYSELMNPKKPIDKKPAEIPYKKLEDVMKMDLIKDASVEDITKIWLEYHKQKEVIAAVIPIAIFDKLMERSKQYPIFIFPVPRSQGFEFMMLQFAANVIHFTPLLCYQVHKENAPECLSMVHYTEYREQGIVLMRGEYDSKILSAQEAQCLANQLQLYYTQDNPSKLELLKRFTKTPEKFSHMDVIKELENLQLV
ncbi:unnamed protein product [Diamesa serratosioi]